MLPVSDTGSGHCAPVSLLSSLGPLQPPSSQDTSSVSQWLPSSMEVAAAHFLARAALASDSSL